MVQEGDDGFSRTVSNGEEFIAYQGLDRRVKPVAMLRSGEQN